MSLSLFQYGEQHLGHVLGIPVCVLLLLHLCPHLRQVISFITSPQPGQYPVHFSGESNLHHLSQEGQRMSIRPLRTSVLTRSPPSGRPST